MTPQFVNTPSNSSQFGSLNGTGAIDPGDLIKAIKQPTQKPAKKKKIQIQSFGGEGDLMEDYCPSEQLSRTIDPQREESKEE